jgi:hypothetical protein
MGTHIYLQAGQKRIFPVVALRQSDDNVGFKPILLNEP